jgi:hypothetical protein
MIAKRCNIMIDGKECGQKLSPTGDVPGMFECPLGHHIHIFIFDKKKEPKPPEIKMSRYQNRDR